MPLEEICWQEGSCDSGIQLSDVLYGMCDGRRLFVINQINEDEFSLWSFLPGKWGKWSCRSIAEGKSAALTLFALHSAKGETVHA